jgi:hypothetical protein
MINILNKNCIKALIIFIFASLYLLVPNISFADNVTTTFQYKPLFSEINFLPGDEVIRYIKVENYTYVTKDIAVEAVNVFDNDGLGDEIDLVIKVDDTILYEDTLGAFLRAGKIPLTTLETFEIAKYFFFVTFNGGAGNELQEKELGFDICINYAGEGKYCSGTTVSNEGEVPSDGGGTPSQNLGNGGIIAGSVVEISNERVLERDVLAGTALIAWDTNILSTSQIIFGSAADAPFSLNLTILPYFGYPLGTIEDPTKTLNHTVLLTGLVSGEVYKFRVVSRASPATVGFEKEFRLDDNTEISSMALATDSSSSRGSSGVEDNVHEVPTYNKFVSGVDLKDDTSDLDTIEVSVTDRRDDSSLNEQENRNLAATLFGYPETLGGWLLWLFLIVFLISLTIYIIRIVLRR